MSERCYVCGGVLVMERCKLVCAACKLIHSNCNGD